MNELMLYNKLQQLSCDHEGTEENHRETDLPPHYHGATHSTSLPVK